MPRGVPTNGQRRPRQRPADPTIDAADAAMALHDPERLDDETVVVQEETPDLAPADDELIEIPTVEVISTSEPDDELTPEQREIKALRDRLAKSEGKKDIEPEVDDTPVPADGESIIIHFLEDGLTALGRVMYRGDELEFVVGSQAHKDTFDRLGRSWLDLRHNEFAQVDRWEKVMFRNGPWPGKSYADGTYEAMRSDRDPSKSVPAPSAEEVAAAEKARQKRAAPKLPATV